MGGGSSGEGEGLAAAFLVAAQLGLVARSGDSKVGEEAGEARGRLRLRLGFRPSPLGAGSGLPPTEVLRLCSLFCLFGLMEHLM